MDLTPHYTRVRIVGNQSEHSGQIEVGEGNEKEATLFLKLNGFKVIEDLDSPARTKGYVEIETSTDRHDAPEMIAAMQCLKDYGM